MSEAPYAPQIVSMCDDRECCPDGLVSVKCRVCKRDWPCDDYKATHTAAQVERQYRYADRTEWPGDKAQQEYNAYVRRTGRR